jgi:hypothetical protein
MKTLKSLLISAVAAAAIVSVPMTSQASFLSPDFNDLNAAIGNITANCTKLLAKKLIMADQIKIVNVEDIASDVQIESISATLDQITTQLALLTLTNSLNHTSVLNGNNVPITFTDFLNDNNVDVSDVVAVDVLRDGKVMVFSCGECCD